MVLSESGRETAGGRKRKHQESSSLSPPTHSTRQRATPLHLQQPQRTQPTPRPTRNTRGRSKAVEPPPTTEHEHREGEREGEGEGEGERDNYTGAYTEVKFTQDRKHLHGKGTVEKKDDHERLDSNDSSHVQVAEEVSVEEAYSVEKSVESGVKRKKTVPKQTGPKKSRKEVVIGAFIGSVLPALRKELSMKKKVKFDISEYDRYFTEKSKFLATYVLPLFHFLRKNEIVCTRVGEYDGKVMIKTAEGFNHTTKLLNFLGNQDQISEEERTYLLSKFGKEWFKIPFKDKVKAMGASRLGEEGCFKVILTGVHFDKFKPKPYSSESHLNTSVSSAGSHVNATLNHAINSLQNFEVNEWVHTINPTLMYEPLFKNNSSGSSSSSSTPYLPNELKSLVSGPPPTKRKKLVKQIATEQASNDLISLAPLPQPPAAAADTVTTSPVNEVEMGKEEEEDGEESASTKSKEEEEEGEGEEEEEEEGEEDIATQNFFIRNMVAQGIGADPNDKSIFRTA